MKLMLPPPTDRWTSRAQYVLFSVILLVAFLMIVPVSVALQAGLASTSLVIFGGASLLLLFMIGTGRVASRPFAILTLSVALFCATVPQLAFLRVAEQNDATLTFNPLEYLRFSGKTTLQPSRIMSYKTIEGRNLHVALYTPQGSGTHPTVVMLHGGGWKYGHYRQTGAWPRTLTNAGYTVLSIEYRLSSDRYHSWRDTPTDVHDAIMYIRQNAAALKVDPAHITLLGQSAGGHLALLEAYRHRSVSSVISLYAPIDLTLDYVTSRDKSAELDFIGGPPGQYADRYHELSPYTHVDPGDPPTLLIQGMTDNLVAHQNATLLADRLTASQIPHELLLLPLTGHSFENQRGGFATQLATQKVLKYLKNTTTQN